MTCTEACNILFDVADGIASPEARLAFLQHCAVCPTCDRLYREQLSLKQALQAVSVPQIDLTAAVMAKLPKKKKGFRLSFVYAGGLIAACAVLVLSVMLIRPTMPTAEFEANGTVSGGDGFDLAVAETVTEESATEDPIMMSFVMTESVPVNDSTAELAEEPKLMMMAAPKRVSRHILKKSEEILIADYVPLFERNSTKLEEKQS